MTTATVGAHLSNAASVLGGLMHSYDQIAKQQQRFDPTMAEFARLLSARERDTIAVIEAYLEDDSHRAVLDVHVRLAAGFPFGPDDLLPPEHPTLDELIELAERTDTHLEHLSERIQVYAVSGQLVEQLDALEELAEGRRRELAAALNELEAYRPSPKQSHD